MVIVKDSNFKKEIEESNIPVLVDFNASWCQPCKKLHPILEALEKQYEGKVKFVSVDVNDSRHIAFKYSIKSVPTVLIMNHGKVVKNSIGLKNKDHYSLLLDDLI